MLKSRDMSRPNRRWIWWRKVKHVYQEQDLYDKGDDDLLKRAMYVT
jgi:hypothetical protein